MYIFIIQHLYSVLIHFCHIWPQLFPWFSPIPFLSNISDTKLDKLNEVDNFLGKYNFPTFNHKLENLNRQVTGKEIETVIKVFPKQKSKIRMLHHESYQLFKGDLLLVPFKVFQKIKEGTFYNSFYRANITLLTKSGRNITQKKRVIGQYLWWT